MGIEKNKKILSFLILLIFLPAFGNELTGKWVFKSVKGPIFVAGITGYRIPAIFNKDGTIEIGNIKMFDVKRYYAFNGYFLNIWIGKRTKKNLSVTVFKMKDFDGNCYRLIYLKAPVKNKYGAFLCKN